MSSVVETSTQTHNSTFSYDNLVKSLQQHSYVDIPFAVSQLEIQQAVDAFFEFLQEPDEVKHHIDFSIAKFHRRGDVGFKHREAADDIYNDNKDFFHYHPALLERFGEFVEQHPALNNFVKKAHPIWEKVYQVTQKIFSTFEAHHPNIVSRIFDTQHPHILLRFLKYEWHHSGQYLAKPHYDAGAFTLAIAESCQGLRIGKGPDDLKIVHHRPNHALFMLSSNYKNLIQSEDLHAGWHDVIQLDQTKIGQPFARWAVVAFFDAHDVYALPRTETHKWYLAKESS